MKALMLRWAIRRLLSPFSDDTKSVRQRPLLVIVEHGGSLHHDTVTKSDHRKRLMTRCWRIMRWKTAFFTILNGIHFVTDTFGKLLCLKHIGRCSFNFSIITPSRGMSADTNYICVCGKSTIGLGCTATAHTGHKRA